MLWGISHNASRRALSLILSIGTGCLGVTALADGPGSISHSPIRPLPKTTTRPLAEKNNYFVDTKAGSDANPGTQQAPWKTAQHGLSTIHSGDTLNLRAGTYREQVNVSINGREDQPITVRSFPGEQAIIDGGVAEFVDSPADAWEPAADGPAGEFKSKKTYPNSRDFVGTLGDSFVGLQTYWPIEDFRAENEFWDESPDKEGDVKPVYCGPGVWYDSETGYLRARLSHTHLKGDSAVNYEGETDPRKLPLILAPFRSVPLRIDQGRHLRFQDLIIRGGGFDTIVLDHADDVEFDHVTVYCGTYGIRCSTTTRLKFMHSALYGNTPPWGFRTENSLRSRKGRNTRDIARLTGHALWVADTGLEFSVYAYPPNDDWEVAYSTFTDSHDGLYFGGIGIKFHHNLIDNMQDDGMYISPVYNYASGKQLIYQNTFTHILTALAFGGPVKDVKGCDVAIYRNVFDLRGAVRYSRPSTAKPVIETMGGHVIGDHGSPPWPVLDFYQNTILTLDGQRAASMGLFATPVPERPRRILNNLLISGGTLPAYGPLTEPTALEAGNLYWGTGVTDKVAESFFDKYRKSEEFKKSLAANKIGSSTKSIVAKPLFLNEAAGDFRPASGSPAINAGVELPADLADPLRGKDTGAPDIGALPLNADPLITGVEAP